MEWESDSPCRSHTHRRQELWSPGRHSGWELELRDCGAIPGWGLLLITDRWIEGRWGRRSWWESQAAMEAKWYCWVTCRGGAITTASLSPRASISSWTIERLAHQIPDTLIYRVGLQSGGPLYVPDVPNNKEGPQAREPSKCLNGQGNRERLVKEAFWSPASRGSEKDSDRAITPGAEAVHVPAHLAPLGFPQARQVCHLYAQLSLG